MTLEKTNHINNLLDFYADLLNDKQQVALNLYYGEDFSLTEIAENMGMTKQAASDLIKRSEKKLENFEVSLQLSQAEEIRQAKISNLIKKYQSSPDLVADLEALKDL